MERPYRSVTESQMANSGDAAGGGNKFGAWLGLKMFIFKGIGYAVCVQTYVYTVNYVYQMELQLSGSMLGYRGMWRRLRQKYHLNVSR